MSQQQHQGQQPIGRTSLRESTTLLQIDAVLSQNGLPYQEYAKPIIRSHLSSLLQVIPSLQVKLEPLSRKDGVPSPSQPFPLSPLLLQVCGTIPISFLQVLYNIPIVIWLPDWYPFCAPIVFVTPSPFMVIKAAHPLVDQSGQVSLIHLYPWTYPSSNLIELVNRLCAAFGKDPPLYSVGHPHRFNDGTVSVSAGLWPPSSSSSSSSPTAITTSCLSAPSFSATVSTSGSMSASSSEAVPTPELPSNANSLLGPGSMPQLHQYGAKAAVPQSALAGFYQLAIGNVESSAVWK
ncbi:hypothetical protein KP509_19G024700 [Ceratopteris richardii]|uniref:UEV domain-containing protein n=1 Tax=Ceratopteris richardii TaxID=49495 RepID=A0A8T2SMA0_CERRI|nr:hypothetical protein KP509_19G024700 [Ceratopteris richardii]